MANEKAEDRIRGILNECPLESPALVQQSMKAMDAAMQRLSPLLQRSAMEGKQQTGNSHHHHSYNYGSDLRLAFLRKNLFQAVPAAVQFCQWLTLLQRHFGIMEHGQLLQQGSSPLQLWQHLDKETTKLLRSGCFQLLPYRDAVGRRICIFLEEAYHESSAGGTTKKGGNYSSSSGSGYSASTRIKASLFLMSILAEDVQTQQQGFVMITKKTGTNTKHNSKEHSFWESSHDEEYQSFVQSLPLRCTADHVWTPSNDDAQDEQGFCHVARGLIPMMMDIDRQEASNSLRTHSTTGQS